MFKYQIGHYYTCRGDNYTVTYQVESILGDRVYIVIIDDTREYIYSDPGTPRKDWFSLGSYYDRNSKPYVNINKELENV